MQLLSYTANTLAPGDEGQRPHLDYPYYPSYFPTDDKLRRSVMSQPFALVFIVMLTKFTRENGGTAYVPHSHRQPEFPQDNQENHKVFFERCRQVTGKYFCYAYTCG